LIKDKYTPVHKLCTTERRNKMTPAQLYDGILKAMNDKEVIELIEQFKSKWEAEAYIKGYEEAINKVKTIIK